MLRRALLLLALPLAGCVVEREREVAWVRYDQAHAEWRADHARWEREKAARDRRVQRSLERQWPQPTASPPEDPLAPEGAQAPRSAPLRPVVVDRRSSGGSGSSDSDWTPPPPTHYVPEDDRVVVQRTSSIDVDVSLGVGYVGYGAYVGPRVYHRPSYVGSYYGSYGSYYGYDACSPRRVVSTRCAPTIYVAPRRATVFVAPRPVCAPVPAPCGPVYRAPAYCPPARVSFTHHGHRSHHGGSHHGGGFGGPAPTAPAPPAAPSWSVKN